MMWITAFSLAVGLTTPTDGLLASTECANRIAAWARAIDVWGLDIAVDTQGAVLLTGLFTRTIDFDPTDSVDERSPIGDADMFVTKLRSDGLYAWTRTVGGTDVVTGKGVVTMIDDCILIAGSFNETVDFDPGEGVDERTASGRFGAYIMKLNGDGSYVWTRTLGEGDGASFGARVALDPAGNILMAGAFDSLLDFDPSEGIDLHSSAGSRDIFVTKLLPDGSYVWTQTFGGGGSIKAAELPPIRMEMCW